MWNKVPKIKDQNWIYGCSFLLGRGVFSLASQSAGNQWEQQGWVMVLVLRSWWVTGLPASSTLSPHPLHWRSFLTQASLSSQQQWGTQMFPGGATESQTLSAVQPEGGSSLAWRVLSLLLEHQLLAFCENSFAARGSIVQSNYVFYSLNLRGSKSALRALSNSNSQTKA